MEKTKRFIRTLLTTGAATILSFLISFLLTPFITNRLGEEAYGFVTLAKNFTSYAAIITIALNSYASRFVAIEYHKGNEEKAKGYVSSVLAGDVLLISAISIIAVILIFYSDKLLNISPGIVHHVKILFALVFFNFALTTIGTPFLSAAYVKNRLDYVGIFKTASYFIEILAYILLFYYAEPRVWYVGFALALAGIITFVGNIYIFRKLTPTLTPQSRYVSLAMIKELVVKGVWNSINSLGNVLNSGLDLLVTNIMLSGTDMGQIAVSKTLSGIVGSFNQLLSQPFHPLFLKSYSKGDKEGLLKELLLSMKVSGLFSCLIFAGFLSLGKAFYSLWLPGTDIQKMYILTLLTFIYMFFEGPIYPLYYIYTLTIKNKIPCIITIIGGVTNVVGMYVLIKYTNLGVYSVVITTTVIMTIISLITNPIYMTKCLDIKWNSFYPSLFRIVIACTTMSVVFYFCNKFTLSSNWFELGLCILIYICIGLLIYFFVAFSKEERLRIIQLSKRLFSSKI